MILGKVVDEGGPVAVLQGAKRKGLRGYNYVTQRQVDVRGCIEAFVFGREACHAAAISSDGTVLRSYAMPIGTWKSDRILELDCRKRSTTTSKHQSFLRRAAGGLGSQYVVRCVNVPESPRARRRKRQPELSGGTDRPASKPEAGRSPLLLSLPIDRSPERGSGSS